MANVGPIRLFSQLSNLDTVQELARFLSAFTSEVSSQFNNLLSNRMISGSVSATGTLTSGANFGVSLITAANYFLKFIPAFSERPSVTCTAEDSSSTLRTTGITTTGCTVVVIGGANSAFSFVARGEN